MAETGNTAQKKVNPSRTATPDAGAKYEISVATLVAAILSNNDKIENYQVFTNLKEAYPFDDVVAKVFFKGENTPYAFAMQLKHIGKGETLDVEKYLKGYSKISKAEGFKTIGNIGIANIHFCYFCVNKVKKADSYTPHQHNPTDDSWRSALSFPNCHKLALNTDNTETDKTFLNDFCLYLYQPDNNKIKENIKTLCKIQDVSRVLNFIDRYFEKDVLWKRGLCKGVFDTELLRIRLSDNILLPPADITQIHEPQSTMWHKLTLLHNVTIVTAEMNIEKSLYGSCAQALNRLFNNSFNWDTYKTNPLDSHIVEKFKKLFAGNTSDRVSHWINPPTTLKSLIIELWKCGEIPLILRSDDNLPVLKEYAHLRKSYIIVTENAATKREECESYQLSVFTHVHDIKCLDVRDELLKAIFISLQGRTPITLHSITDCNEEFAIALSCSHIIHLMKSRTAYLSKECLNGDHNLLFLIEDPNSTAEHNINSISSVGSNIAIRCRPEDTTKYREQIDGNPKFQNYEIYHCVASLRYENLSLLKGNKLLVRDFFVDQDGEGVYALGNKPVPIVGFTLKDIQPRYMPRFLRNALVSESLFDSKTKGICFFSGDFSCLNENIRQHLMEAPDDINFDNKNTFIKVRDEHVDKHWQKASDLNCPLLHIRIESADMQLRRYKDWTGLSEHIAYNGREIPEEDILEEVTDGITILTGEPGIGKSSLLRSICKNHAMEKYILFYNLVDYGRFLRKEKLVPTNISLDFLLERSINKRYKEFLSALFRKKDGVLILLDSFDEVLPTYKENVLHFIRNLTACNVQIIIASRTIANYILMANFETSILEVDFLKAADYGEYLMNYRLNEKILTSIPDEFLQSPLYLNLLKIISENSIDFKYFSRLSLFQNVIEIKMEQYFQKNFSCELDHNKEHYLEPVRNIHFHLALMRILGTDIVKELLQLENKIKLTHELKLGVVLSINEEGYPTFVHETFAEYLTADWIVRNKTKDSAKKIYQELKKQEKLYILDILCERLELHKAVLTQNKQQIEMYAADRSYLERTDDLGRMAIHIAAACQPDPLWSVLDIIICNMRNFKMDFTRSDVLMQWDWVQHSYQANIIRYMIHHPKVSTSVWKAYVSTIAQKAKNDDNYMSLFSNDEIKDLYHRAISWNNIQMMRDLLFIEDLKYSSVSQTLDVDTLHSRNIRKLTALHVACIYGNVEALRKLIKWKNVNVTDEFDCTPLHYSVMNPPEVCTHMTKILLESGSEVDIRNYYYRTALDIAVHLGNVHTVELLLQKYVSIKNSKKRMLQLLFRAIDIDNDLEGAAEFKFAYSKGHSETIEFLLGKGVDVNYQYASDTPFMFATKKGRLDIVNILLEKGANVDGATICGETPLVFACKRGKLDIVKILLEKGANINGAKTHYRKPLTSASRYGKLDIVKILLEKGANIDGPTTNGRTSLMFASEHGRLDVVNILLEKGANVHRATTDGITPLMLASQNGSLDIVKILLEKGANVDGATTDGITPLMFASDHGRLDIVNILLEKGANVNGAKTDGTTPLMSASQYGGLDIVKILLEKGANLNGAKTDGTTPLMLASQYGRLDIVKILLEKDADINGATTDGITSLMLASRYGKLDIVKILLEKGANVDGATTNGRTPLMYATEFGELNIVKILLEKGADINGATTVGITSLMLASRYGKLDIVKILLEKDANVNGATTNGRTPLMFASQKGNLDIVKILLEKGANVDGVTTDGVTSLMFASRHGRLDIVKILLAKGANVNGAKTDGRTPLMCAAEMGELDIVNILLEKGANVNGATTDGKTPLMLASECGGLDVVKILLEKGANVDGASTDGITSLMLASEHGRSDIEKILLEKVPTLTAQQQMAKHRLGSHMNEVT